VKQGNLSDEEEKERILKQYAGIFKRAIKEFGETIAPRLKTKKNYSR
jgi:hypothetical protein